MATEGKKRKSGKFCVAGGPGLVSCKNTTYTEGISMHLFPKDLTIRSQWDDLSGDTGVTSKQRMFPCYALFILNKVASNVL